MFLGNGSIRAAAPFPLAGPGEPLPAFISTMKPLRHPAVRVPRLMSSLRDSAGAWLFVLACALPGPPSRPSGLEPLFRRCSRSGCFPADTSGTSQVSWRPIPYLCPARRPRPNRSSWPSRIFRCCPQIQHGEGFGACMISRLTQGFGTRCLRFTNAVAAARARLASGRRLRLCREGVEPSGSR